MYIKVYNIMFKKKTVLKKNTINFRLLFYYFFYIFMLHFTKTKHKSTD